MIEKINLLQAANSIGSPWKYQKVGMLNNHVLNVVYGENRTLDFHIHEQSDEMFYCIEGNLDIEFDDGLVPLCAGEFLIVPQGVRHRPVCTGLVKCLLIELDGTLTKKNTGGTYK